MTDWKDNTITGRMLEGLEEMIVHHVNILIDDDNEWFNELLDRRIDDRLKVREQNNEMS
mgnify:FL=1|jgi:hypothetical protein